MLGRQARAQFDDEEVLWSDKSRELAKIHGSGSDRLMITAGLIDIMEMKTGEPAGKRFQMGEWVESTEAMLDLRVPCVVPVGEVGIVNLRKECGHVAVKGELE